MYSNLKAEMARRNVSTSEVAGVIKMSERNVRDKISGKYQITVPEAKAIKRAFFPEMSLEYLFSQADDQDSA